MAAAESLVVRNGRDVWLAFIGIKERSMRIADIGCLFPPSMLKKSHDMIHAVCMKIISQPDGGTGEGQAIKPRILRGESCIAPSMMCTGPIHRRRSLANIVN